MTVYLGELELLGRLRGLSGLQRGFKWTAGGRIVDRRELAFQRIYLQLGSGDQWLVVARTRLNAYSRPRLNRPQTCTLNSAGKFSAIAQESEHELHSEDFWRDAGY